MFLITASHMFKSCQYYTTGYYKALIHYIAFHCFLDVLNQEAKKIKPFAKLWFYSLDYVYIILTLAQKRKNTLRYPPWFSFGFVFSFWSRSQRNIQTTRRYGCTECVRANSVVIVSEFQTQFDSSVCASFLLTIQPKYQCPMTVRDLNELTYSRRIEECWHLVRAYKDV